MAGGATGVALALFRGNVSHAFSGKIAKGQERASEFACDSAARYTCQRMRSFARCLDSHRLLVTIAGGWLLALTCPAFGFAQEVPASVEANRSKPGTNLVEADSSQAPSNPKVDWLGKAQAMRAFIQGEAGPELGMEEIFELDFAATSTLLDLPQAQRLATLVAAKRASQEKLFRKEERKLRRRFGARIAAQRMQERWQEDPFLPALEQKQGGRESEPLQTYLEAAATFLSMPRSRQDAMWRIYAQRPESERPRWSQGEDTPVVDPEARRAALTAFVDGTPDPAVELEPLLRLDLRNTGCFLWEPQSEKKASDGRPKGLLESYYRLDPPKRDALYSTYRSKRQALLNEQAKEQEASAKALAEKRQREKEAEIAAQAATELERQRAEALRAAKEAQSSAGRLAATERARLLSIRSQQEAWSVKINQWREESKELHEQTMALVQSVAEYDHKEMSPSMAGNYYDRVSSVLGQARRLLKERLSESLAGSTSLAQDIEQVGPMPPLTVDKEEVERLRFELSNRAAQLLDLDREVAWTRMIRRHEDLMALNQARLSVLAKLPGNSYSKYAGVTASGWQTVIDELSQMRLELQVRWLQLRRRLSQLTEEIADRATSILWVVVQIVLLILLFRWWRMRGQDILIEARLSILEKRREYPILGRVALVFWYLIKIRSPLEWWLLGWVVAKLWLADDWVEMAIIWTVYKWLVGGVLAVSLLNAFAVQGMRRNRGQKDKSRQLRIDTLRLICYTGTGVGLILALAEQLVGRGAFYSWVRDGAWVIYIPMIIYLLIRWKPTVYERCERLVAKGSIPRWVVQQDSVRKSMLGTIVGAMYLMYQGALKRASRMLMGLESVRKAAAFLLRREVMSNAQEQEGGVEYCSHPMATSSHFDPDAPASEILPIGPSSRIEGLISSVDEGRSALVAVVGGRGAGKSSFLSRLVSDSDERIYDLVIDCPAEGLSSLYLEIEGAVGASLSDRQAFEQALDAKGAKVLCVDNLHRLVWPTIGGLAELDDFIAFARGWSQRLSWVVAMEGSAWRYTKRARGNRVFFDEVINLRPWNEQEIVSLLDSRNQSSGLDPDFSTLKLSRPEDEFELEEFDPVETQVHEEMHSNRRKYYRVLWEYSGGNPGVALHAWSRSLYQASAGDLDNCVARVFPNPDLTRIEKLSLPALFTLRAIVQLEMATEAQVVECTNLAEQDCADAVRVTISAGYVYRDGPWLRIHWDWHRAVVTVLVRQHLLASS